MSKDYDFDTAFADINEPFTATFEDKSKELFNADFGEVTFVNVAYSGGTTDDIVVKVDSDTRTISANLTEQAKTRTYVKEVVQSDWELYNTDEYRLQIMKSEHNIDNVDEIVLQKTQDGCFENIGLFTYKVYFSGKVAIILDKQIDGKIIIKGR